MSNLTKDLLKSKLKHTPHPLPDDAPMSLTSSLSALDPLPESELEESTPDNVPASPSPSDSSASSTSTIRPTLFTRPSSHTPKATFDPLPWNTHFSLSLTLPTDDGTKRYHAYLTPPAPGGPLFVCHHGAGSSGLSFALLASAIRAQLPTAGVLSPDARAHGQTATDDDYELSLETLRRDFVEVIELTRRHMGWGQLPDLVLVGHSLGGAVVVDAARSGVLGAKVLGYACLDIVEGAAVEGIAHMSAYLAGRPPGFKTVAQAVEWHVRSRTIRNPTSARVSVPALLVERKDGPYPWVWRTELGRTQEFWEGWFVGMSRKFLEARGGKLLVLAEADRLDKEMMVGQMQGKYQLVVMTETGHFVMEDQAERTATTLVEFFKRNDRSALVLPPKFTAVKKA